MKPLIPVISTKSSRRTGIDHLRLTLLGRFELSAEGRPISLPWRCQRLIALLALRQSPVTRTCVAGTLWPEVTEERALTNLRSTLWTMPKLDPPVLVVTAHSVTLTPQVAVDYEEAREFADVLLGQEGTCDEASMDEGALFADLLPDWSEDWILVERERFRQLRLHGLEALCNRLTQAGRHGRAVYVGMAAVEADPLRESAHGILIRAYLAEGNRSEAVRQYRVYSTLVREELGLDPSPQIESLLRQALTNVMSGL
jgi:DNA-binding SARP family transcriptional activator